MRVLRAGERVAWAGGRVLRAGGRVLSAVLEMLPTGSTHVRTRPPVGPADAYADLAAGGSTSHGNAARSAVPSRV